MPKRRSRRDQRGQAVSEYAVLLGVVVAGALLVGTLVFVALKAKADEGVKLIKTPAPAVATTTSVPGGTEVTVPGP